MGDALAAELGRPARVAGVPWGADMRLWCARGIPCVMVGPRGIELAHGVDERVAIDDLAAVARTIVRAAWALLVKACLNGNRAAGLAPGAARHRGRSSPPTRPPPWPPARARCTSIRAARTGASRCDAADVDAAVRAIRAACPGVPVGVTTGAWIVPAVADRVAAVRDWTEPDFASVNLSEEGHVEVMAALRAAGVGIEAGVWTVGDAAALARSGFADDLVRVLIEPRGRRRRRGRAPRLGDRGGAGRRRRSPRRACTTARTCATWAVLERAVAAGRDIRVGLEDTLVLADGSPARDNAHLVAAAVSLGV